MNKNPLGEMLVEVGAITRAQLDEALSLQASSKGKLLGDILVSIGYLTEKQLMSAMEYRFKTRFYDLSAMTIPSEMSQYLSHETADKYTVVAIGKEGRQLILAMTDPMNFQAIDDVKLESKLEIKPVLATASDIRVAITKLYEKSQTSEAVENLNKEYTIDDVEMLSQEINENVDNAPVVKLVNLIMHHAIEYQASDIHIEPMESSVRIRFRIDGELQEKLSITKSAHAAVVTRFKILGDMDIAEKRLPQDGSIQINIGGSNVDLRISVLPTINGEKIVIRVLGGRGSALHRKDLGFTKRNSDQFDEILKNPNGILLVSGPTGSGKSTTLYTVLNEINKPGVNIITVEDPVEYRISGINQVQVNPKAGLTFAGGLRSILRQDPDVIMIGEIRDGETAEIAVRASITGHLVLSTIHTNDSASTVTRLVDMGIEPFLVSASLVGVISQRLVRKICASCKTPKTLNAAETRLLGLREPREIFRGAGCPICGGTGYKGRTAIHEVLVMNRELRELVDQRATVDQIRQASLRQGTTTLRQNCTELVLSGETTIDELIRVTYTSE